MRRRFQRGSIIASGKRRPTWVARYLEDVVEGETVRRVYRAVRLSRREFPTKRLAERELERMLSGINHQPYAPVRVACFADFANQWRDTVLVNYKASTQADMRSQLSKYLIPAFGSYPVREIGPQTVQAFIAGLKNLSPKRIKNLHATLRLMFKQARAWGFTTTDPVAGVVLPRPNPTERKVFTLEETRRILSETPEPLKTFLWLAAETGMRAGELCALREEDVSQGIVSVRQSVWRGRIAQPKTARGSRSFAASEPLQRLLVQHVESIRSRPRLAEVRYLFATRSGRPWDPSLVVKRKLYPLLDRLGIVRRGLHSFRHGNASLMDRLGAPIKLRQERLGHADASTTMDIYTHVASDDATRIAGELGALLGDNSSPILSQVSV